MKITFYLTINPSTGYAFIKAKNGNQSVRVPYHYFSSYKTQERFQMLPITRVGMKAYYECTTYLSERDVSGYYGTLDAIHNNTYALRNIIERNLPFLSSIPEYEINLSMSFDELW